jgi:Uma2 family endonuclease
MPGSGYEILDGKVIEVPPAHEPHAERNSKLAALLEAHVSPDFNVAVDMLTRTGHLDNFAPDASVYPVARDPETGGRQLEHLAFEIASTETLGHAAAKAAKLTARGVRRVFAVDVEHQRVLEWSAEQDAWQRLWPGGHIVDPCLAAPLPVDALAVTARADDAVASALLAKGNAVLLRALSVAEARGEVRGLRAAIEDLCEVLGVELTDERRRHLEQLDAQGLTALRATLKTSRGWP